jgi:hypothetical protein
MTTLQLLIIHDPEMKNDMWNNLHGTAKVGDTKIVSPSGCVDIKKGAYRMFCMYLATYISNNWDRINKININLHPRWPHNLLLHVECCSNNHHVYPSDEHTTLLFSHLLLVHFC